MENLDSKTLLLISAIDLELKNIISIDLQNLNLIKAA